jgi:hypothetical protein
MKKPTKQEVIAASKAFSKLGNHARWKRLSKEERKIATKKASDARRLPRYSVTLNVSTLASCWEWTVFPLGGDARHAYGCADTYALASRAAVREIRKIEKVKKLAP